MSEMTRRRAVLLLGALSGSGLVGGLTVGELLGAPPWPAGAKAGELLDRFSRNLDGAGVDQLGAAYLELYPSDNDADQLIDEILSGSTDGDELNDFLRAKVQTDFEAGRTVELNDWALSYTEGRILAAIKLSG